MSKGIIVAGFGAIGKTTLGNKYDNKELLKYYTTVLEVGETEDGRLRITEFIKPEDCHFPRMTEVKE